MVTNTLSVRFSTIRKNTIILKSIFMKTRKMYNSSANLKKMSITLALSSAMLCPVAANAQATETLPLLHKLFSKVG